MMPYDSRPPILAPQFFPATNPYNHNPMTSMAPAHTYQPQATFTGYGSYASPATVISQKQDYSDRPQLRLIAASEPQGTVSLTSYSQDNRGPCVEREPQQLLPSTESAPPHPSPSALASAPAVARNVSSPVTDNSANQAEFFTCIDTLMRTIQSKEETEAIVMKVEPEDSSPSVEFMGSHDLRLPCGKLSKRQYECEYPGCTKSFSQKTHLDAHRRSHTGDKPYVCRLPGCGLGFSQIGNLKTHERRHTGERPYQCENCGKRFSQRSNLMAHTRIHSSMTPIQCKLDGCTKNFTRLGNLKAHQNRFHAETLENLTAKFAAIKDYDAISEADQELWEYFTALYKNSNKGIKGRGRGRKVRKIVQQTSPTTPTSTSTITSSQISTPHHHQYHRNHGNTHLAQLALQPTMHQPLPFPGLSHPAAYSMSRPSINVAMYENEHLYVLVPDCPRGNAPTVVHRVDWGVSQGVAT